MTIETLAEKYRLKITRDECHNKIIEGGRGHLYTDAGQACAVWIDARPMNRSRLEPLGGKRWMGDISPNKHGRRVQDAKIIGILPEKIPLAIRLCGIKRKRIMSAAQQEALTKLEKHRFRPKGTAA